MIDEKNTTTPEKPQDNPAKPISTAEPSTHTWVDDMKQELEDYLSDLNVQYEELTNVISDLSVQAGEKENQMPKRQ